MNQDEPPRIQPEGRAVKIRKEEDVLSGKPEKSKRSPRRKIKFQDAGWNKYPSTWNAWVITEYKKELRSFPDWRSIASREMENKKRLEEWHSLPIEVRRAKNKRKPKDPKARQEKLNAARRRRQAERPHIRTIDSLRARFRKFITKGQSRSIGKLLGCTLPEFKKHLESQFTRGMNWQNYGSKWHIDHILPCASFDHTDPKQVERCWHYTNMRPLDAIENMRKGKTIAETQMSLQIGFAA